MAIKVTRPQIDLREEINKALTLRGLENQLITVNGLVSDGMIHVKKSGVDAEVEGLRLSHGQTVFNNSTGYEHAIALTFDLPSVEAGVESNRVAAKVVGRKGVNGTNDWYTNGASTNFNGQLDFYTRKDDVLTNKMTINEEGYVGIGSTNPATKLYIYEDDSTYANTEVMIHNNKSDDAAVLRLRGERTSTTDVGQVIFDNSNKVICNIRGVTDDNTDDGAIQFWTATTGSNAVVRAVIDSNGNWGLRTSDPGYEHDHISDFSGGETKVLRRRYDEVVVAYNHGTSGTVTSTITVTLNVAGLRGTVLTADFSGSRNNSGPDNYIQRIVHTLMSEGTNLRRSDRISALEFASGASRVAVNSVTMSSDKIVVEYEIAAGSAGYDARMLFTAKGPGINDLDVSVST
jgi:hypothetical protein